LLGVRGFCGFARGFDRQRREETPSRRRGLPRARMRENRQELSAAAFFSVTPQERRGLTIGKSAFVVPGQSVAIPGYGQKLAGKIRLPEGFD